MCVFDLIPDNTACAGVLSSQESCLCTPPACFVSLYHMYCGSVPSVQCMYLWLCLFSVLVTGFTCFFTFPLLFAQLSVVVRLFLRLRLALGFYRPFGVEKEFVFRCLPSFLLVLPSRFVVTQLVV